MSKNLKIKAPCLIRNEKTCELEICKNLVRVFFGFRLGLGLGDTVGGPVLVV